MKSTHKGHCQACGRLQMLPQPGERLALHGYKVTHGYFSGTCVGSKELPFEVSHNLLPGFIRSAQAALATVEKNQAMLRERPTTAYAWVKNYQDLVPGQKWGKTGYVWQSVQVNGRLKTYGDSSWVEYFYEAPGTRGVLSTEHKIETYGMSGIGRVGNLADQSVDVAWHLNRQRADSMEKEAENLRRYIAWQQERIATWKPQPLLPVDAKSKAGFVVVE